MDSENNVPIDPPQAPLPIPTIDEEAPFDYKVPDYIDAMPIGKSLTILGGVFAVIIGIIFMLNYKNPTLPDTPKDKVDFSKMKGSGQQQQQQGQVAGVQDYNLPEKPEDTPKPTVGKETPTPSPTTAPDSPTNTPTPSPTKAPDPTSTPMPTDIPTPEAPTETPTSTP